MWPNDQDIEDFILNGKTIIFPMPAAVSPKNV